MKKPRLYFDTSVFGGIHDVEFQMETNALFEMVNNGEIICLYSDLTELELENAPDKVKNHFLALPKANSEFVEITEEINQFAQEYVREKVVGETSIDDCRHIACATINKVDYLVSWNFKHIVNIFRIRGYNAINIKNGYIQLDIRSPKDIIKDMNNKEKKEKDFDTVKFFREVKEKIAKETQGISFEEFKAYLNKRKLKLVR